MLGCSCLRRKVIALKTPKQEQSATDKSEPQGVSEENKAKWKKKNKKRKTYGQSIIYCNRCTIIITKNLTTLSYFYIIFLYLPNMLVLLKNLL